MTMDVKTNFAVGDEVWYIDDDRPTKNKVQAVNIRVEKEGVDPYTDEDIRYYIIAGVSRLQNEVFPSLDELKDVLFAQQLQQ